MTGVFAIIACRTLTINFIGTTNKHALSRPLTRDQLNGPYTTIIFSVCACCNTNLELFCSWFCVFSGNKLPTQWHNAEGKKWKEGHRVKVTHPKVTSPDALWDINAFYPMKH